MRKPLKITGFTEQQNQELGQQVDEWLKDLEASQNKKMQEGDLLLLDRTPKVTEGGRGRLVVIQKGKDRYLGIKFESGWDKLWLEPTCKVFDAFPGTADGAEGRMQVYHDSGAGKWYAYFKVSSSLWKRVEIT